MALAATAAWSSSGIFIAYLTGRFRVPPLALAFWRNLFITGVLFLALLLMSRRLLGLGRRHLPLFGLYGLVLAALNGLFSVSVALNGAAVATLLIYSAPVFSAVAARIVLGEPLGPSKISAVTMGLVGSVLISGAYDPRAWDVNAAGIAVGLGAGVSFAAYGLVGKLVARRGIRAWTAIVYSFLTSTAIMILVLRRDAFAWLPESTLGGRGGGAAAALGWGLLVALALGPTLGGHGLYTASLAHLPASTTTLITTLEPPLTAVLAYLLLGERLGTLQLVGGCLVLIGVVVVTVSDRRNRERERRRLRAVHGSADPRVRTNGARPPGS